MPTLIRPATWNEVALLFYSQGDATRAQQLAAQRAARYMAVAQDFSRRRVYLEAWSHTEIGELMDTLAAVEPRMTRDMVNGTNNAQLQPRIDGLPLCVIDFDGRRGMIDGKHRANQWRHRPGRYPVLVVEARIC